MTRPQTIGGFRSTCLPAYFIYNNVLLPTAVAFSRLRERCPRVGEFAQTVNNHIRFASPRRRPGEHVVWIHAASVGEVGVADTVAQAIQTRYDARVVVSTMTTTGLETATKKFGAENVFLFPLDWPPALKRCFVRLRPDCCVIVETEIWPNFFQTCADRDVPLCIVNGRISPRAFERYEKMRFLFRYILPCAKVICVQTEKDRRRFLDIGAPPDRVRVTGNVKIDQCKTELTADDQGFLKSVYTLPPGKVIVCGATHEGEERILLDALKIVRQRDENTRMIIAPRYIERGEEIAREAHARGFQAGRRSKSASFNETDLDVYIVDVFGELTRVYGLADVAFVGGTFVKRGGQNVLEPAALGKPVVYGDSTSTVQAWCDVLESTGGSIRVRDPNELPNVLLRFLENEEDAKLTGARARQAILAHSGALTRTLDAIAPCLARIPQKNRDVIA